MKKTSWAVLVALLVCAVTGAAQSAVVYNNRGAEIS